MTLTALNRLRAVPGEVTANFDALDAALTVPPGVVDPGSVGARNLSQPSDFLLGRKFGVLHAGTGATFQLSGGWYICNESEVAHAAVSAVYNGYPTVMVVARLYYAAVGTALTAVTLARLATSTDGGATWTTDALTERRFGISNGVVLPLYNNGGFAMQVAQTDYITGIAGYVPHNAPQDRPVTLVGAWGTGAPQGTPVGINRYAVALNASDVTGYFSGEIDLHARDASI